MEWAIIDSGEFKQAIQASKLRVVTRDKTGSIVRGSTVGRKDDKTCIYTGRVTRRYTDMGWFHKQDSEHT